MDENYLSQLREIIGTLTVRTRESKMEWIWDEWSKNLTAKLTNGQIVISKDRDFDTVIRIVDTDENVLEEINAGYRIYADLKEDSDELHQLARRSALKVDSKLDSILQEISA